MAPDGTFRLCVDLNVWFADFIARAKGVKWTTAMAIVDMVESGRHASGGLQLVVSHAMLSRLTDVLVRKGADLDDAVRYAALIGDMAKLGPSMQFPLVVLGGGVLPSGDSFSPPQPYRPEAVIPRDDFEDGRVLDAAFAGRADAIVTDNLRDFAHGDHAVIIRDRVIQRESADHSLLVVRPPEMLAWLRTGITPKLMGPGEDPSPAVPGRK
jgi:hypothetical protein